MNLRNYKNVTDYNAYKPFLFPAIRDFSPKKQWAEKKKDVQMLNPDFKKQFSDRFSQKNANELLH